jgi:Na+-transporting methylmalonyl-CoA/oxaloacetate decarboxylase gamma subunit
MVGMDWGFAAKMAFGGFGTVFVILVILWVVVEIVRVACEKMAREKK